MDEQFFREKVNSTQVESLKTFLFMHEAEKSNFPVCFNASGLKRGM